MKLSFSTLPCMNATAGELKEICEKFGFSGAEVRLNNDNTFTFGEGLNITNLGSSICIKRYDEKQLENAIALFKDAEKAGIGAIRVFLGNFFRTYDTPREEISHSEIVKMLQSICDCSKTEVWVETHNEYATGKALRALLDDVDRENIKIIWDIIHPIEDGEMPEETLSLIGKDIYTKLIKGYTEKQWGRPCNELPPFIIKRLPVRFTYDNNYFNDPYQGIPIGGYNVLIDKLLEKADVITGVDFHHLILFRLLYVRELYPYR